MIARSSVVTAATVFAVRTPDGHEAMPAELRYDVADPYAVTVVFRVCPGRSMEWVFGRDLLAEGLAGAAGDGDVRIRREAGNPSVVIFELDSPFGHATMDGVSADLTAFLGRSFAAVPSGAESGFLNLDGMVDLLLSSGAL